MDIKQLSRAVAEVGVNGKDGSVLLISDLHWDNPHCDRALLKRHLDEALEINAPVFVNGDLFCVMQGKYDRRKCKSDIRPEHNTATYLDDLVETAIEWFAPYASILAVIGKGNHETAIIKNHETDLTDRLCAGLRTRYSSKVICGGYGFWVHLKPDTNTPTIKVYAHHGSGGGGPVTKGVIQTNRRQCMINGADVIWSGHIHEAWCLEVMQVGTNRAGDVVHSTVQHVCTPTYKEEYGDGTSGWHVERMAPPKPLGGYWMDISRHYGKNQLTMRRTVQ
jgi:hypothetical protein